MKKALLFAVATVGAMIVASAGGGGGGEDPQASNPVDVVVVTSSGSPTPRVRRTATPSPTPTSTPLQVCSTNPDPALPSALQVEEPKANAEVRVPVHVRGWGSTIGQDNRGLTLSIVDQKQNVLQVNELPPLSRDYRVAPLGLQVTEFTRPFAADVVLENVTVPTPYCLWIYLGLTDQGRATGVVQVPVIILPRQ
jgi:hypothetical protein